MTCRGVATPIVSARTSSPAFEKRSAREATADRVDPPLEGAPEGDADRDGRTLRRLTEDRRHAFDGLVQTRVAVSLVEALGRAKGEVHTIEPAGREALEALLVQHEADVLDSVATLDSLDDLLGAGHLRHCVVTDEAHGLDPRAGP